MRVFLIAADVVMGLILGLFVFVVVSRTWRSFDSPVVAALVLAACVLVVLFRRPGGSLLRREGERLRK